MAFAPAAEAATGRVLEHISRLLAYFGGIILAAVSILTVISIIGRAFTAYGLGPITGDFELVEAGAAVAVFAFLPWCQMNRGHVTVDIFIASLPLRAQAVLGFVSDLLITAASYVILWRLWLGFGERFPYGSDGLRGLLGMGSKPFFPETTYELELPIWIPFGLALIGATAFFIVSLYTLWRSLNWVLIGQEHAR